MLAFLGSGTVWATFRKQLGNFFPLIWSYCLACLDYQLSVYNCLDVYGSDQPCTCVVLGLIFRTPLGPLNLAYILEQMIENFKQARVFTDIYFHSRVMFNSKIKSIPLSAIRVGFKVNIRLGWK